MKKSKKWFWWTSLLCFLMLGLTINVSAQTNLALNKSATSSSQQTDNTAASGNDGSNTTRWCANNGNLNEWWKVDLGSTYDLTGAEVMWELGGRVYKYKIEVSADNYTWTVAVDKTFNTSTIQTQSSTFTATGKRYVRITVTGMESGIFASFFEFKVFGGVTGSNRAPENPSNTLADLDYTYYEGTWDLLPNFDNLTPAKTGTVSNYDLSIRNRNDYFAVKYTGYINISTEGSYTFYTSSDDGSKLFIGTTEVVNNDGLHGAVEKSGTIGLQAGKHAITVTFFEKDGGENLSVSYEGPGVAKTTIPSSVLFRASTSANRIPENPSNTITGLDYKYYEGTWDLLPNFDNLTPAKTGTVSNYDLSIRNRDNYFAVKYTGYIDITTDGSYTFYTSSDDGSKLFIGTTEVVNNDGLHGSVEKSGVIGLQAGKHAISVTFFEKDGGENLSVNYAGPSVAKTTIPSSVLYRINSSTPSTNKNNLGMNILGSGGCDYNNDKPWADVFKTYRDVNKINADGSIGGAANLDANGWPTEDAKFLLYHGLNTNNNSGTYKLSFIGKADISSSDATIQNKVYNSTTNTTTADVIINNVDNNQLFMEFRNTTGGIKNAKLMRPVQSGSSTSYATDKVFTDQFLRAIEPFTTIRFMDWTSTNACGDSLWSDRTLWTYATQQPKGLPGRTYGWQGRGACWESVIMMCNLTNKDAWICIPHKATDDYITNLAKLFRDGNEHTPGLKSNLKLYVEYSNEIWNWASAFSQTPWCQAKAKAIGVPLNYDGETDQWTLALRYKGMRTVEISNIFRSVFGDNQMMERVRPVLCGQQGVGDLIGRSINFMESWYSKKDSRSTYGNPHPINYYLYGSGASNYFYADDANATADNIWDKGTFNPAIFYNSIKKDASWAAAFGLEYLVYEGNSHPNYNGDERLLKSIWNDTRFKNEIIEHHNEFNKVGGGLNCYFDLSGGNEFGFLGTNIEDLQTPKYQALVELSAATPADVTLGSVPPFTRDGNDFDMNASGWQTSGTGKYEIIANNIGVYFLGYNFHVNTSGTYNIQITYNTTQTASMEIQFNGNAVATLNLANTNGANSTTAFYNINCTANKLYSIRVLALSGKVNIVSVQVGAPAKAGKVDVMNKLENKEYPIELKTLKVYPNPAKDFVNVEMISEIDGNAIISVFNSAGVLVKKQSFELIKGQNLVNIPMDNLIKGIYYVSVFNGNSNLGSKIIVE